MIQGLYQSAAGMLTNEYRQSVVANNLANADTVGFKRDIATLAERLPAARAGERNGPSNEALDALSGGVWLGRTYTDFSPGAFQTTDNPLDLALEGPGFFAVEKDGQRLYTRDGRIVRDPAGRLLSAADGAAILDEGGRPIVVNPHAPPPFIDETGALWQNGATVGRVGVFDFEHPGALQKAGASRFSAGEQTPLRVYPGVRGGHVELSGVQPVSELVSMIEASRAYQLNAQMITLQDQAAGRLITFVASA
ncbi:MAG: flagellar hook-basal body protein [Phycisphaerae bacterium]